MSAFNPIQESLITDKLEKEKTKHGKTQVTMLPSLAFIFMDYNSPNTFQVSSKNFILTLLSISFQEMLMTLRTVRQI
jgi:hypothetical protein